MKKIKICIRKCLSALIAVSISLQFSKFPENNDVKASAPEAPPAPSIACLTSISVGSISVSKYALPTSDTASSVSSFLSYIDGKGGEGTPIIIDSLERFKAFAFLANNTTHASKFNDKYIELTIDVDLGGSGLTCSEPEESSNYAVTVAGAGPTNVWTPIGTSANSFKGYFNGNNHTISNLVVLVMSPS